MAAYGLIPLPSSVRPGSGEFTLTAGTALDAPPELAAVAAWLRSALGPATGCALLPSGAGIPGVAGDGAGADAEHAAGGEGRIVLALGPGLAAEEFRLRITPSGVRITGGDAAGVFYGAQTLRLLLPPAALRRAPVAGGPLTVPATEIEDRPRYGWRGCMLDVARHFMPKADLLRFIDLLSLHRLNVLHLHLTDDQGWRVEIAKYPRLTSVGGWRSSSMLGSRQHETFLPRPHGGFYTADDVREIVAYAAERYVTVVPEIDLPGHTQAAVAAYPWLAPEADDGAGPVGVRAAWGLSPHCLDVTSAAALDFCRDVLDEVMELFPGSHVGIGGDDLDALTVARIRREIAQVARGPDYAWPALRLNQFNWPVDLFAVDAQVNGTTVALASGLARHLRRFLADRRNLGPGLRFRYLPRYGDRARSSLDSPEYANIVLSFSRHYTSARAAGMTPPPDMARLREWIRRALAGYWTHAGYLNWDTGLGFARWQQRKKVSLAQRALIGIAGTPELQPSPEEGAWAKWLLDRGLDEYVALVRRTGHLPAGVAYGVHEPLQSSIGAYVAAARYAGNAMRALDAGLATRTAVEPPAMYSYDPDTGKLAISTPTYNTAIVPVNQHAFPYGGLDIARLLDAHQEVAASLGGTGPAVFGLSVRSGPHILLRTQYGAREYGTNPLHFEGLRPAHIHAGPFTDLRIRGTIHASGLAATSAYRFTPTALDAHWSVRGSRGHASVTFPSWGRGARVVATLCEGGGAVTLGHTPRAGICSVSIRNSRSGYDITPTTPIVARLIVVRPQATNPNPGPSVVVDLGPVPATLAATLAVVPDSALS